MWAFALAFIVVLLAVGVAALVMVEDEDEEVVDEPITTTTLAAPQSTTTPPTTAAVNGGDAEPVSFVSGLGTLTWTKVVEEDPLRDSVIFNPEFSYLSCDWWANCWASGDGLSWRPVEGLPDHGNAVLIRGYGNTRPMALASPLFDTRSDWPTWGDWNSAAINAALHQDAAAVFALEDGRWVEVGSVGPLPEAVDIVWRLWALPRAPSGEYALEMDLVSELPLVEVYGGFDKPAWKSQQVPREAGNGNLERGSRRVEDRAPVRARGGGQTGDCRQRQHRNIPGRRFGRCRLRVGRQRDCTHWVDRRRHQEILPLVPREGGVDGPVRLRLRVPPAPVFPLEVYLRRP